MGLEFYESGDTISSAGIAIGISDLPMVAVGEFVAGESQATKEGKFLQALGVSLQDYADANSGSLLGFSHAKTKASVNSTTDNKTYAGTFSRVSKLSNDSFGLLPVPSGGANAGVGDFSIADIFANAEVVSASDVVGTNTTQNEEMVVIPDSDMVALAAGYTASVSADARGFFELLYTFIARGGVAIRDASTASAVVATSNPDNYTSAGLAAAATQATDPTTDIGSSELGVISTVQKVISFTVQSVQNESSGTFEVSVATS